MEYKADKDFIYLKNPPFKLKDVFKDTLNGVWFDTKKGKGWKFPKNVFVYRELYKYIKELRTDTKFIDDGISAKADMDYWINRKENFGIDKSELRPYQSQDAFYLKERGSALVLNEPRTGKTPTMIRVIAALGKKKNLVVCPSSLVLNWAKEFQKWFPECEVVSISGDKKARLKPLNYYAMYGKLKLMVLIISKDTFKKEVSSGGQLEDSNFDTMIVDEAHFLRNYKSAQSQAIFSVSATHKYALTGTPSVKHGSDVYGLLHFIDPIKFSSFWQFTARYWNIEDNGWGKDLGDSRKAREDELKAVISIHSVQRKRKEVMKWLPKATHQTIPVELGKKQLKLYDSMFETFVASADDLEIDVMNKLVQLTRLRQLCLDPRLLGFKEVGAKTTALLEFAEDNTDPFVVMTTFSSYFDLVKPDLEKLGKRVGVIDGSVSKKNRQKLVDLFQNGKIDILLCNIIAAGTGLTLDKSDTILFLDKDYNPANNEQAQDRIVPTTEERYHPINVISLVASGTVDERVNEILDRKEDLTKVINRPELLRR